MAKILITGASGFIGGYLVEKGLKEGHTIFAAIRKTSNKKHLKDKRINIIYPDLSDKEALKQCWNDIQKQIDWFDYVIHNAGATKVLDNSEYETVNYQYTKNLLESLKEAKIVSEKFIYISSLAAYGPGNEKTLTPINLSDKPSPITLYGKSKLKTENYLFEQKIIPFIIFRPTGVYGPRDTGYLTYIKSIKRHIELYIGSSKQMLSFVHVNDLASLIFKSLPSSVVNHGYFVSDGNNYTCKEFAAIVKGILKKKTIRIILPAFVVKWISIVAEYEAKIENKASLLNTEKYKELTSKNWSCDSTKTLFDFDFTPQFNLQNGMRNTIDWYKKEHWL